MQDLGAIGGHLEHFLVADLGDAPSPRDDARVGSEDAVDVGVDLAEGRTQGIGEGDGGRVGGTAAQGGDVLGVLGDALEAGHDDDAALVEGTLDAAGGDVDDAGIAVGARGDHPGLRTGVAAGLRAQVGQGHGQQRGRLALTGGQQHVEFAGGWLR
ncbi:Uncharacterised protein [Mycobacteroides abscessus subsp. abscessus]|nr:Uncharacterised protein [Mycobacteroides abscessus subsp. abscessus]